MNLFELPSEMHPEIFQWLNPYQLNQVSRTCKKFHSEALINGLWDKHHKSEFPYSLEKTGTSFQKYSICKYKTLKHIESKLHRECLLLVEAGHLPELIKKLPELKKTMEIFLSLITHKGKFLPSIMNEQDDQTMKDFFYSEVRHKNGYHNFWAIKFGKVNDLVSDPKQKKDPTFYKTVFIHHAVASASIESLEYLFQQEPFIHMDLFTSPAIGSSLKVIRWLDDHDAHFKLSHFYEAAFLGHTEFIRFMFEKYSFSPDQVKCAIYNALSNGRPGTLEELLSHFQHEKSDLDQFFKYLDLIKSPNETAACLKILLDKGATIAPLILARIPYNNTVVQLLIDYGTKVTFTGEVESSSQNT